MSITYFIENILNWEEGSVKEKIFEGSSWLLFVQFPVRTSQCPFCHHEHIHIKDYRDQKVLIGFWNSHAVYAIIHKRRFFCPCCHKSFYEKIPGLSHYQRRTDEMRNLIIQSCTEARSFSAIARSYGVSVSTVIKYFDQVVFLKPLFLPPVLSLDEFRGNTRGQKYQVVVNNPQTHDVLDILPRRDTTALIQYFMQFSRKQRLNVKFVVMDLSMLFRKVVKTVFPNAVIIGDRFHIQRLVIWALERVRKNVQAKFKEGGIYFKRNKRILNKRGKKLTDEELVCLREILKQSPQLQRAYAIKEAFYNVYEMKDRKTVETFLAEWVGLVKESGLQEFKSIVKTFKEWKNEILEGLTNTYSNGFTEGTNNKIKVLKRIAFGYRNFERFRSRILLACTVKFI